MLNDKKKLSKITNLLFIVQSFSSFILASTKIPLNKNEILQYFN